MPRKEIIDVNLAAPNSVPSHTCADNARGGDRGASPPDTPRRTHLRRWDRRARLASGIHGAERTSPEESSMHEGRPLPMSSRAVPSPLAWRHHMWLSLLVVAVSAFSFVAACATPFAAFAAVAALTLSRGDAFRLTVALWLADQIVGYAIHGYPRTAESFAWGVAIAGAALLATWTARWAVTHLQAPRPIRALSALVGAFTAYEAALFAVAAAGLGGTEHFTAGIVAPILALNAAAFVGLCGLHRLGAMIGLSYSSALAPAPAGRPISS
jgi:hypothetical protein